MLDGAFVGLGLLVQDELLEVDGSLLEGRPDRDALRQRTELTPL